ncbi:MAG: hypothetical protein AUH85_07295 [Chloroflexi bacterium 13_1_40CM_4_68_4]|nr:MAG: hypothetical protein AUH85_07295 [Chloroflexi bacterium 13_1_40CM_4_68_4]
MQVDRGVSWLIPLALIAGVLAFAGAYAAASRLFPVPGLVGVTTTPPIARSLTPAPAPTASIAATATATSPPSASRTVPSTPSAPPTPSLGPAKTSAPPVARIESYPLTSTRADSASDPAEQAAVIVECIAARGEHAARRCVDLLAASER